MMANDWQRLKIWVECGRTFDYEVYKQKCIEHGCVAQGVIEFAQKAGLLTTSSLLFPELEIQDAYLKLLNDNPVGSPNELPESQQSIELYEVFIQNESGVIEKRMVTKEVADSLPKININSGCSSCGGGRVL